LLSLTTNTAMIGESQHLFIQIGIIGDKHAAFTGSERLAAMKGEGSEPPHRPCTLSVALRTDRFGGILDNRYAMASSDIQQRIHVAHITVQVHGNDGPGARCDRSFGQLRIDAPALR